MHRNKILKLLDSYAPSDKNEEEMVKKLAQFVRSTPNCFDNRHPSGHVTASAWIVDIHRQMVGLVHHGMLNKWIQPGGHSDGSPDTPKEALREAMEEFGDVGLKLFNGEIFDIDIHTIPEDKKRGLKDHLHYDVRFLVIGDSEMNPVLSDESHELRWVPIEEVQRLNNEEAVMRMVRKTPK